MGSVKQFTPCPNYRGFWHSHLRHAIIIPWSSYQLLARTPTNPYFFIQLSHHAQITCFWHSYLHIILSYNYYSMAIQSALGTHTYKSAFVMPLIPMPKLPALDTHTYKPSVIQLLPHVHGPLTRYVNFACYACTGNAGKAFPAIDFKGNH